MDRDWVVPGLGDAGAHVSQIMDSGWASFLLSHWVRDQGKLSLAEAVRRMTGSAARVLDLKDRGTLAPGMKADINVFDPDRVEERRPEVVRDFPSPQEPPHPARQRLQGDGGKRPHHPPRRRTHRRTPGKGDPQQPIARRPRSPTLWRKGILPPSREGHRPRRHACMRARVSPQGSARRDPAERPARATHAPQVALDFRARSFCGAWHACAASDRWIEALRDCAELARELGPGRVVSVMDREANDFRVFEARRAAGAGRAGARQRPPPRRRRAVAARRAARRAGVCPRRGPRRPPDRAPEAQQAPGATRPRPPRANAATSRRCVCRPCSPRKSARPKAPRRSAGCCSPPSPPTPPQACRRIVEHHARRWRIEDWHRVLKSGCKVEELQAAAQPQGGVNRGWKPPRNPDPGLLPSTGAALATTSQTSCAGCAAIPRPDAAVREPGKRILHTSHQHATFAAKVRQAASATRTVAFRQRFLPQPRPSCHPVGIRPACAVRSPTGC